MLFWAAVCSEPYNRESLDLANVAPWVRELQRRWGLCGRGGGRKLLWSVVGAMPGWQRGEYGGTHRGSPRCNWCVLTGVVGFRVSTWVASDGREVETAREAGHAVVTGFARAAGWAACEVIVLVMGLVVGKVTKDSSSQKSQLRALWAESPQASMLLRWLKSFA